MSDVYLLSRTRSINRMPRTWCIPTDKTVDDKQARLLDVDYGCTSLPITKMPVNYRTSYLTAVALGT